MILRSSLEVRPDRRLYSIFWEGSQLGLHSFAQVNRELCSRLIARGHELNVVSSENPSALSADFPGREALVARFHRAVRGPVVAHVRHTWPPNFTPPQAGHWVLMQPWEFGSLPKRWVGPESHGIDEFWAYSRFVRDCYIKSGVSADRVHVVPLGVDTSRFHSRAEPLPVQTTKAFKFLFVGGAIHRKGIDILLNAFVRAFTADDPVCLVIKDVGSAGFYRRSNVRDQIKHVKSRSGAPEIVYIDRELSLREVAGLYTACNCLVHPYRGEGFGLPIAEAMASGLPVIVTGYGAALDFCTPENAFLLPARSCVDFETSESTISRRWTTRGWLKPTRRLSQSSCIMSLTIRMRPRPRETQVPCTSAARSPGIMRLTPSRPVWPTFPRCQSAVARDRSQ